MTVFTNQGVFRGVNGESERAWGSTAHASSLLTE